MLYKIEFKPQSLKDGKKIPKKELERIFEKEEFLKIQEELNDYEDFKELRKAKKQKKMLQQ